MITHRPTLAPPLRLWQNNRPVLENGKADTEAKVGHLYRRRAPASLLAVLISSELDLEMKMENRKKYRHLQLVVSVQFATGLKVLHLWVLPT